jgi:hypothetical protein
MSNGCIKSISNIDHVISQYTHNVSNQISHFREFEVSKSQFKILSVGIRNSDSNFFDGINKNKEITLEITYENKTTHKGIYFNLKLKNGSGEYIFVTTSDASDYTVRYGMNKVFMIIPDSFLNDGIYSFEMLVLNFEDFNYTDILYISELIVFELANLPLHVGMWSGKEVGFVQPKFIWK